MGYAQLLEGTRAKEKWHSERFALVGPALLLLIVLGIYFSRVSSPNLRGEESRRGEVAQEMLQSGDWVVPRQQGRPFLDRPPLQSWLIATISAVRGGVDTFAIRLPSVVAVVLTTIMVFTYARCFLSLLGALVAALGFATMGQVLELGRLGETESVFTFLVSASLLIWHFGYMRKWPLSLTYLAGYSLAGLASLTKGPQAPIYFIGAVVLYLAVQKDWRTLFNSFHLAGLIVLTVIITTWEVALARRLHGSVGIGLPWTGHVNQIFFQRRPANIISHLIAFPGMIAIDTLPWSAALGWFVIRGPSPLYERTGPYLRFLLICLFVAFPTCWLPPNALPRYIMPLYPILAVLIGVAFERGFELASLAYARQSWISAALIGSAGLMVIAAISVLFVGLAPQSWTGLLAQPPLFAIIYAFLAFAGGWVLLYSARRPQLKLWWYLSVLVIGSFMGLSYGGAMVNWMVNRSVDTEAAVNELKHRLPANTHLTSVGPLSHLFVFYFHEPITGLDSPEQIDKINPGSYFCFDLPSETDIRIPFEWTQIAAIPVSRSRTTLPQKIVIVARRL
jgi:Dolichyl-phosphate-mannose-protein mannosyltransferase